MSGTEHKLFSRHSNFKPIKTQDNTLLVHSIESFGTHDGPGVRMVVFLQGCKLKCVYCHNPDTIDTHSEDAQEMTAQELLDKALKLKPYFGDKGGVTVSGGEPLLQSKALIALFKLLKENGIHTNLDTNGRILNHFARTLIKEHTDLLMLDIKHMTEAGFQFITGQKNVKTTFYFAAYLEFLKKPFWLRFVLIPEMTNNPDLLHAIGTYFKDYQYIEKIEIQPYHKLGIHKWEQLGWDYPIKEARENSAEEIQEAVAILETYFKEVRVN